MKGYIVLKDSTVVSGEFIGSTVNVMGKISVTQDGKVSIVCEATGNCVTVLDNTALETSHLYNNLFATEKFDMLVTKLNQGKCMAAKLVIDELPLDYHLYDVKTWLGYSQPAAS
jgi:hypothetical protein